MDNIFKRGDIILVGTKRARVIDFPLYRGGEYLVRMLEGKYKGKDVSIKPELLKPL